MTELSAMPGGEILVYEAPDGDVRVRLERETVWLTQQQRWPWPWCAKRRCARRCARPSCTARAIGWSLVFRYFGS
jgi:hypothetical protein